MTLEQKIFCKGVSAKIAVSKKIKSFIETEDGDTNFISIALILVIVVAIAIVFRAVAGEALEAMVTRIKAFFTGDSTGTNMGDYQWTDQNTTIK